MIYDVSKYEELVSQGYLRKSEKGDLVLYKYTEKTTHEKFWNEYTRQARGLILNKHSGYVIAKPFPKFFNLGEMPESRLENLRGSYTVAEKLDGSLGIIYYHNYKWNVATCGSLESEQALKAEVILEKYKTTSLTPEITLLVEIIYPSNKIVVNYGQEEKLVLLGAYYRVSGEELDNLWLNSISTNTGIPLRQEYTYSIGEMIALQATMPKDQEGFVVRFDNGLRVKIKGEEYLKVHKIVTNLSPLSFWEVMEHGKVPMEYIQQVPEEFRNDFEPIVSKLESNYMSVLTEIDMDFDKVKFLKDKREVGLFLKDHPLKHNSAMFPMFDQKGRQVDGYIMKSIRPKGNQLD